MFSSIEQPGIGTYSVPNHVVSSSRIERGSSCPAPRLGQHTDEILFEVIGLDDPEIGRLHDEGVVAQSG